MLFRYCVPKAISSTEFYPIPYYESVYLENQCFTIEADSQYQGFSFVLLPSCLVLLAACSPAPSDRIAKNMPAYEQLPKEHQAKVARGELEKGMSPMAVLLAWGEPEQKMAGRLNGKNTERWIYTRSGTGWSLGLGGGGFRGRDSGIGTGIGVTMPLGSRPPVSCNVLFEDGKVIGWEAVNGF